MDDQMQVTMAEATRLTKAGRLSEATRLIQNTLQGFPFETSTPTTISPVEAGLKETKMLPGASGPATVRPVTPYNKNKENATAGFSFHEQKERSQKAYNTAPFSSGLSNFKLPNSEHHLYPGITKQPTYAQAGLKGQFVDRIFTNSSGTLHYKLYIPGSYHNMVGRVPLVVMLHGCTQSAPDFAAGTGMNQLAEQEHFLVAYPEQPVKANNSRCWNWFQANHQQRGKGEPSLIAGITHEIIGDYRVDNKRVYVAGLSAGGAMAAIMAATYPDIYAAIGVHSGLAYGAARNLPSAITVMRQGEGSPRRGIDRFIPLIVFQGDQDTTVSPVNADNLIDQWLQVSQSGSEEVKLSGRDVTVEQNRKAGGHAYSRFNYNNRNGKRVLEKWVIHRAGHAWSGGNLTGSFTDPQGPNASGEMIRFFLEHTR